MSLPGGKRQWLSWLIFAVVLLIAWGVAAPTQLGGPVSYVMVDGTSMQPTYSDGDLVLAKSTDSYDVGDVVTYVTENAGRPFPVIHRIIKVNGDGTYVTQGDNRAEADDFYVSDDNIIGETWVRIPHAAGLADFFKTPTGIGVLAGLFVFSVLTKDNRAKKRGGSVNEVTSARV